MLVTLGVPPADKMSALHSVTKTFLSAQVVQKKCQYRILTAVKILTRVKILTPIRLNSSTKRFNFCTPKSNKY